jgi:hypothetical protein
MVPARRLRIRGGEMEGDGGSATNPWRISESVDRRLWQLQHAGTAMYVQNNIPQCAQLDLG